MLPPDEVTTAEKIHSTLTTQKSHFKKPPSNSQGTATYTFSVHRHTKAISTFNYQAAFPTYTVTWSQWKQWLTTILSPNLLPISPQELQGYSHVKPVLGEALWFCKQHSQSLFKTRAFQFSFEHKFRPDWKQKQNKNQSLKEHGLYDK